MLTKDLLRVSRRGGGYQPRFVDHSDQSVAARVIGCYQGHTGKPRGELQDSLTAIERDSDDFKLVRGFSKLLDREATWEVQSPVEPRRARKAAFAAGEAVGVVTRGEREQALERAAETLGVTADAIETALYADRETREILTDITVRWNPETLVDRYNLSLAQTALFDAYEVRIQTSDPKRIVSAVKRLRLLYEIRKLPEGRRRTVADNDREIIVTGPDTLFRKTRRYGTRFARLLRTVTKTADWRLEATINDRGTERKLVLTDEDLTVLDDEPIAEVSYDSAVEEEFATRFDALDLDWNLVREPDAIEAGEHVIIPDFALDWKYGDFRVYFEIMGFWTPEYVEKKLDRLAAVDDVELLIAVDESLGVGDDIESRDHRAIPYAGSVNIKDIRNALRRYEDELVAETANELPEELTPEDDVITLATLAKEYGVSESALEAKGFPAHERVGRTLLRPAVLDSLREKIEAGMTLETVDEICSEAGIEETSSVLSTLGFRVEWEGLGGGTVRKRG